MLPLAAAWLLQGCSFLFVDTPPTVHGDEPPAMRSVQCTSSVAAPVVDTVIAAFEAVRTGFALGADDADYHNYPISRGADIAIGLGLTGLFAAAAGYGYVNTSECSDLKEQAREPPPPGWVPPPPRMPPPTIQTMCSYDAQCKGDRICEGGRCVSPPPSSPPPAEPPPAAPEPAPTTPAPSVAPNPSPGGGPI
jgi:hypothetical protein